MSTDENVPAFLAIPARLRMARERAGLTRPGLSLAAGLDRKTCANIEEGRVKPNIYLGTLEKLAVALSVSPRWLAFGEGQPTPAVEAVPAPRALLALPARGESTADRPHAATAAGHSPPAAGLAAPAATLAVVGPRGLAGPPRLEAAGRKLSHRVPWVPNGELAAPLGNGRFVLPEIEILRHHISDEERQRVAGCMVALVLDREPEVIRQGLNEIETMLARFPTLVLKYHRKDIMESLRDECFSLRVEDALKWIVDGGLPVTSAELAGSRWFSLQGADEDESVEISAACRLIRTAMEILDGSAAGPPVERLKARNRIFSGLPMRPSW